MPYVELAPGFSSLSSHFVMAWQLLNTISLNESLADIIYGSCLVYKGSVVCTQLDVSSTRWIANIVEGVSNDISDSSEVTDNFYKVFVNISSISNLIHKSKTNNNPQINQKDNQNTNIQINPEQNIDEISKKLKKFTVENIQEDEIEVPGKIRAGVYIVHLQEKISICMLMNWRACFESSYFNKIFQIITSNSGLTKKTE